MGVMAACAGSRVCYDSSGQERVRSAGFVFGRGGQAARVGHLQAPWRRLLSQASGASDGSAGSC
jgi:hypothetical protein